MMGVFGRLTQSRYCVPCVGMQGDIIMQKKNNSGPHKTLAGSGLRTSVKGEAGLSKTAHQL
jgi:hypothetical protein